AIVTEQVEGWYEYLIAEGVPMRAELSLTDGRPHDGFVAIDPEGYYLEFERFNSHGENQALMPVLEEIEPLGGVTVSFFTDDVDAWFTRAQGVGLELRTSEVTSESERVRVFVGYDPEVYFLEWDTFLPVGANARLLGVLDRSAPTQTSPFTTHFLRQESRMIRTVSIATLALAALSTPSQAQSPQPDSLAVAKVVAAYHEALQKGDSATALRYLALDAVVLESGGRESRQEYRSHHLPADMQFAQAVPSERSSIEVAVAGDVAWAVSTSHAQGTFRDRAINSQGAELMVLSRTPNGWVIRAIHWSSRNRRTP
ncbi:MAG: DUF4440 domain-containing protein, partial [Gemmatimonadales bacterium]